MKKLFHSAAIIFSAFILSIVLNFFGAFVFLENKSYDARMKSTGKFRRVNEDIIFIGVDQYSIDRASKEKGWSWPWPREAHGKIAEFLKLGDAASLTYDVLFTEPSIYGSEDDKSFGNAAADFGKVIQTMYVAPSEGTVLFPVQSIKDGAALLGNITSVKDSDDIIRRVRFSYSFNGKEYPTLGVAPLLLDSENPEKEAASLKENLPFDKDGNLKLCYKGSIDRYAHYSAYDILESYEKYLGGEEGEFLPKDFEAAHVFFILYAPGLFDICSTPVSQVYPGAGIHITLLDNILSGDFIRDAPSAINFLLLLFFSWLGTFFILSKFASKIKHRSIFLSLILVSGILILSGLCYFMFLKEINILFIPPLFCFIFSFAASLFADYSSESRQRRFIKSAFSQYLSPAVIDRIIVDPNRLKLGGEKRHITIFFSDIQSFTSLSEKLTPEKLTDLLNKYLTEMTNIILDSGGTIDKYEGDAIIAFWNAPADLPDHPKLALEAAVKCQKRLEELSNYFTDLCGRPLWTRIGLNTGDAIVGNMGSSLRFDYTMLGDSVNLASRLEGLNKQFGTYLMCSKATKEEAEKAGSELKFRELANVAVVGKKEAVTVFEPLTEEVFNKRTAELEAFEKGRVLFYKGKFAEALSVFEKTEDTDPPSKFYAARCRSFTEAPPVDWDAVWHTEQK